MNWLAELLRDQRGVADYLTGRVRLVKQRCATCIFHKGNPMYLKPGRVKDMTATAAARRGHITCHHTLSEAGDGLPEAVCHGHAATPRWALTIDALTWAKRTGLATWVDTHARILTYQREGEPVDPAHVADRWLTRREAQLEEAALGAYNIPAHAAPVPTTNQDDAHHGWTDCLKDLK